MLGGRLYEVYDRCLNDLWFIGFCFFSFSFFFVFLFTRLDLDVKYTERGLPV